MKEHGILFSGAMVRAILDGSKTQTRRVVTDGRDQPVPTSSEILTERTSSGPVRWSARIPDAIADRPLRCPAGQPGDRVWVRETWQTAETRYAATKPSELPPVEILYRASHEGDSPGQWRPGIFLPRWAARIVLEIVEVRIERLHLIGEGDARDEGVAALRERSFDVGDGRAKSTLLQTSGRTVRSAREMFEKLWDEINGKRAPWSSNPFVWVITFERVKP